MQVFIQKKMLKNIDHIGIIVPDIEAAKIFYETIYGARVDPEPFEIMPGLKCVFARFNNCKLELLEPVDKKANTEHAWFLRDHPKGGIHHIAYSTEDVDKTIKAFDFVGCNARDKPMDIPSIGKRACFLDPYYTNEIITEIISE